MDSFIIIIGMIVIAALLLYAAHTAARSSKQSGKTRYLDRGKKTKALRSKNYRIAAKPDRIYINDRGKTTAHEFKSRKTRVYERDIVQVKVTAIAARDNGFNIDEGAVELGNGKIKYFPIESNKSLMSGPIGELIHVTRSIKRGGTPRATPSHGVCRGCPFKEQCRFAL